MNDNLVKRCRKYIYLTAILGFSACASKGDHQEAQPARQHPNVLLILADDQSWGDLSMNGNPNLSTPHIDSLATNGVSFDRFVSPVCSPTRAELLTGRFHTRGGVYSTSAGGERLDLDEIPWPNISKRRVTKRPATASGTTVCSTRTIPMPGGMMIFTASALVIGATTSAPCWREMGKS